MWAFDLRRKRATVTNTAMAATMAHLPATPALDEFTAGFTERYGNALVPS